MKLNDIKKLIDKGKKDPKKLTAEEITMLEDFESMVPVGQDVEEAKEVLKSVAK